MEPAADESFAAMRARIKFGIAIAAITRIIAITIRSSISEKPFCFCMASILPSLAFAGQSVALGALELLHLSGQVGRYTPMRYRSNRSGFNGLRWHLKASDKG